MKTIAKKTVLRKIRERLDEIHSMMTEISHHRNRLFERYNLSISRVQQWIIRGVVPSDCVFVVPELNYLKLFKNKMYYTRTNKKSDSGNIENAL